MLHKCTQGRTLVSMYNITADGAHKASPISGLINTSSYLRCSWCLGHRPSGRKEHPRRLRNCTPPQRPTPGWSGRLGSRCFRFSATKSQPRGLVSRVSVVVSFLMASQGLQLRPFTEFFSWLLF